MTGPELHVSGGAGGTYARYEDIELLARHSEQLGCELAGIVAECHAMLASPDVLASTVLHPSGVARFEGKLLDALDGPGGLSALAIELTGHAALLRAAANSYQAVDAAQAQLIEAVRWGAGGLTGVGATLLLSNPVTASLAAGGLLALYEAGEAAGVDWQQLLTDHPGVIDNLVGVGPGLITGLPGPLLATDVPSAARLLAMLYPDGTAEVNDLGIDDKNITMTTAPGGFGDLLAGLNYRNGEANGAGQGQIDVRIVTQSDGSRAFIVDIPGTKDWHPTPLQHYDQLNDLGTNLHAMGGDDTAYQQGIVDALRRAGADSGEPVMLVGHSQGGIVAAQMAADLAGSDINVTHVVTVGSPVGQVDIPGNVQVLSLENEHDIVPHLDASDNPDRANRITVTFDTQNGTIGENHSIADAYLPAAQSLDRSTDPSVQVYQNSASMFFAPEGTPITSRVYQITRG